MAKCALLALTNIHISHPRHPYQYEQPYSLIYVPKEHTYTEAICQLGTYFGPS